MTTTDRSKSGGQLRMLQKENILSGSLKDIQEICRSWSTRKLTGLKQAEHLAAVGATAGMVGHDIRNPLQAMLSDVYLLREALADLPKSKSKKEIAESVKSLEENVSYINKIVADLQDYPRPLKPEFSQSTSVK